MIVSAVALAAAVIAAPVKAQEGSATTVKDYALFVDLPTAFAFIKLPTGWKFVGKLDASQLRHLPPDTLTSLLTPEDRDTHMAGEVPMQPAER
jgi:hypothetical protein